MDVSVLEDVMVRFFREGKIFHKLNGAIWAGGFYEYISLFRIFLHYFRCFY